MPYHHEKPYYQEKGITIYHGDCLTVIPALMQDGFDIGVTITDPPYNVGKNYGTNKDAHPETYYRAWLHTVLAQCPGHSVIFFPGLVNVFDVADLLRGTDLLPYQMLGWHRKEFAGDLWTSGPAICWEPIVWAIRSEKPVYQRIFGSSGRNFLVVNSIHGNPLRQLHPCPKPLEVMMWLVSLFTREREVILDPFCGTGTTLLAAKELGRQAIGIEIEERYCEISANRLRQQVLPFERRHTDITQLQEAMSYDG